MTAHRALIVDDERLARVALREVLEIRPDVEVVGEADCIDTAVQLVGELRPDVIVLDVQMPGESGFDLFDRAEVTASVVFVTAYDEYAVRAFEVNALYYLVKPVGPEQIDRSLKRLCTTEPPAPTRPLDLDDVVCLNEGQSMKFASVKSIVFISAADDYTEVHTDSGKVALVPTALREWEERLPAERFARTHRSTLVNLSYIDEVLHEGGTWTVTLRGVEATLPMSRRFAQALRKRLDTGGR